MPFTNFPTTFGNPPNFWQVWMIYLLGKCSQIWLSNASNLCMNSETRGKGWGGKCATCIYISPNYTMSEVKSHAALHAHGTCTLAHTTAILQHLLVSQSYFLTSLGHPQATALKKILIFLQASTQQTFSNPVALYASHKKEMIVHLSKIFGVFFNIPPNFWGFRP